MQLNRRNPTRPILNRDAPITANLLAWVPYDRNLIVAPGGASTVTGGPSVVGADFGGESLQFSSAGTQYVSVSNVLSKLNGATGPFTFILWFYGSVASNYTVLFDSFDGGGVRRMSLFVGPTTNKFVGVGGSAGSAWSVDSGKTDFSSFEWQMCGLRISAAGSSTLDVIRNGMRIGGNSGGAGVGSTYSGDLSWGRNASGGGAVPLMARCDGALWNRGLTDTELWSLYEPSTRWQLYWNRRAVYFDLGATAPRYWGGIFGGGLVGNGSIA